MIQKNKDYKKKRNTLLFATLASFILFGSVWAYLEKGILANICGIIAMVIIPIIAEIMMLRLNSKFKKAEDSQC